MSDLLDFLTKTIGDQVHLTVIHPDNESPAIGRDFGTDVPAAADWASAQNAAGMNVYYSVNLVRPGVNKKPAKADIVGIRFAHVDIDPPKMVAVWPVDQRDAACQRIMESDIQPTIIVWSGNGWQALWRVAEDSTNDQIERVNRSLIAKLGGDNGTHNADRLLRLPGLTNYPTARKRSWGRTNQNSQIIIEDDGTCYSIAALQDAFPCAEPARNSTSALEIEAQPRCAGKSGNFAGSPPLTADGLGLSNGSYLRKLIDAPDGMDRSNDVFHFACEALRHGLTQQQIAGVLLNGVNAISAHCLAQADPERAARRAIESALREPDVYALARQYERSRECDVSGLGEPTDDAKIWTLEAMLRDCVLIEDGAQVADTTRRGHVLSKLDFKVSTAASTLLVQVHTRDGSIRTIVKKVADEWLAHPTRRTVATQTFRAGAGLITTDPNGKTALNTWRGFRTTEPPADWELRAQPFIDHVDWLFGAESGLFLDWVAHLAQQPGELPSIAFLHIAPRTGMGRNLISSVLERIFAGYTALSFPLGHTLKSGFNGSLAGKVLAIVDEIDEGDSSRKYQLQQDLKQLVTEETRTINPKYGRQHVEWNACRWLIFSNSEAAIPLEDNDRRFVVVRSDDQPKSQDYYSRLYRLRDDPEFIASVAEFVRQRDISSFKPGMRAPMTAAKASLQARVRSEWEQAAYDIAERWPVDVITSDEIDEIMGDDQPNPSAKRYMLERAGLVKLRAWKVGPVGGRKKVTAYAVRNVPAWKAADITALRIEIARVDRAGKEAAFYGKGPTMSDDFG